VNEKRSFSDRHGFTPDAPESLLRQGAPEQLRLAVVHFAIDAGYSPESVRERLLNRLVVPPEPQLWVNNDNILKECYRHLAAAEWFEVYDFIEDLHHGLIEMGDLRSADLFQNKINRYFEKFAIGWKLADGNIETRGAEAFEAVLRNATDSLRVSGLAAATQELHEALRDLSRRPRPDLTGSVQHAAAALECVAREATGDPRATLGQILSRFPNLLPVPLPDAIAKIWGYASETARHIREGNQPTEAEAELVVGLVAVTTTFLLQQIAVRQPPAG